MLLLLALVMRDQRLLQPQQTWEAKLFWLQ
jgi:hypothetical protein